jgi:hypothetical protein
LDFEKKSRRERDMTPIYVQIFSVTDHRQPLNDRYQGPYTGINAELQTSEYRNGTLKIAENARTPEGEFDQKSVEKAKVILSYRHSDTGVLTGTSESLIPLPEIPWKKMPGLELQKLLPDRSVELKLWTEQVTLSPGRVTRIRFGETTVYLKNFGEVKTIDWTPEKLTNGPFQLHAEKVHQDLTITPPGSSGFEVKLGQGTAH